MPCHTLRCILSTPDPRSAVAPSPRIVALPDIDLRSSEAISCRAVVNVREVEALRGRMYFDRLTARPSVKFLSRAKAGLFGIHLRSSPRFTTRFSIVPAVGSRDDVNMVVAEVEMVAAAKEGTSNLVWNSYLLSLSLV